jgi:hypothetical protein
MDFFEALGFLDVVNTLNTEGIVHSQEIALCMLRRELDLAAKKLWYKLERHQALAEDWPRISRAPRPRSEQF